LTKILETDLIMVGFKFGVIVNNRQIKILAKISTHMVYKQLNDQDMIMMKNIKILSEKFTAYYQ